MRESAPALPKDAGVALTYSQTECPILERRAGGRGVGVGGRGGYLFRSFRFLSEIIVSFRIEVSWVYCFVYTAMRPTLDTYVTLWYGLHAFKYV